MEEIAVGIWIKDNLSEAPFRIDSFVELVDDEGNVLVDEDGNELGFIIAV